MTQRIVLFGGTGFLGRALLPLLVSRGFQVRVPTRDIVRNASMKLYGKPGQVTPFLCALKSDAALAEAMEGADAVVNLVGILAEKGESRFQSTHVEFAARLARLAKDGGIRRFVHLSALGAREDSSQAYLRTKAFGEKAVRAFFPEAVILRPCLLLGSGGGLCDMMEKIVRFLPFAPLVGTGEALFQPLPVEAAAKAVFTALEKPEAAGQTFELGGEEILPWREIVKRICAQAGYKRFLLPIPSFLAFPAAFVLEKISLPLLTRDQIRLLAAGSVVSPGSKGMKELGV